MAHLKGRQKLCSVFEGRCIRDCIAIFSHNKAICKKKMQNICHWEGHLTVQSDIRVGHLITFLAQGGGNLNKPNLKSSNPGGRLPGRRMLYFRMDQRIACLQRNHLCAKPALVCKEKENLQTFDPRLY